VCRIGEGSMCPCDQTDAASIGWGVTSLAVTSGGSPQTDCHNKCTDTVSPEDFRVSDVEGGGLHVFSLMGVGCFLVSFKWVVGVAVVAVKFLCSFDRWMTNTASRDPTWPAQILMMQCLHCAKSHITLLGPMFA